ncbi:LOW QUALITY PROTEIN: mitochondrial mRNA pseudouridine synthase RPUSD3 [Echinops telfairi]|uniref:LOW QUALITY PROTEIN: mitochondrial mRNA pseudouridine synthase RPUSD3 n=1 Tax=Echinops telfairi TaxID=9371 RepID=A0ABM0IL35_ECHTE|nr:LOW QUALITY PROTEIN: mitochondrial mRNA pseudouridine synthase RPUSD3 [Echinops telfairi]
MQLGCGRAFGAHMRAVFCTSDGRRRYLGRVSAGWRPGPGVCAVPQAAGLGTEARNRPKPRHSDGRSGCPRDPPFPGLLQLEGLSATELVDVLRAGVVDQKGPLVVVNKPPGLPVTGKPGVLTLLSVLPELSQALGLREGALQVVRAPEKDCSGLVLLSSCPQTASNLHKFFARSRRVQRPTALYWAVTDGIPATSEGKIQAALRREHTDGVDLVIPVKTPSRKDILEGVKRTVSHFRVVATGSGCALVQLQPLTVFPSQLQVHMTLQLCPVLGDHKYSARVSTVLGQRFLLPAESTKSPKQVLDEAFLRHLRLTPAQATQLPLHLHLHRLLLPGPRPQDAPTELLAPLPPYFSKTLHCLGLQHQASPPVPGAQMPAGGQQ